MSIAERISLLRKERGLSQEQLAEALGVSRQAVSKWEAEKAVPELEKLLAMSELFEVSTDYLLKGTEQRGSNHAVGSRVLYIISAFLFLTGLLSAIGAWYEEQSFACIAGGLMIEALGAAAYFIGAALSRERAHFGIQLLNIAVALFIPVSMAVAGVLRRAIAPYPTDIFYAALFVLFYGGAVTLAYRLLKKSV